MENTINNVQELTWEQKREIERKQETEKGREMLKKLLEIVKGLGHTVKENTDPEEIRWGVFVLTNEGLFLETGRYHCKNKIHVYASFPRAKNGEYIRPYKYSEAPFSINIATNKPTEKIVSEINRRFMPWFTEKMAEAKKLVDNANTYEDKTNKNLENLKGFGLSDYEKKEKKITISEGEIYGNATVHGDSVSLEIRSLTPKQAKMILEIIKKAVA